MAILLDGRDGPGRIARQTGRLFPRGVGGAEIGSNDANLGETMKFARRLFAAFLVVSAVSATAHAQAMSQVPASAMVVVHLKNFQDFSQKLAALAQQMNIGSDQAPGMTDLLGYMSAKSKMDQGWKKDGDFAVALFGGANSDKSVVAIVPVTDYAAFQSNYPGATTDGAITTITMPDGETDYLAKWGDYAAISPVKDLVSQPAGGLKITPAASKQLDDKDVCILVNMPMVRMIALPMLTVMRPGMDAQFDQHIQATPMAKYAGVIKVAYSEFFDLATYVLTNCNDVTWGANLTSDGISTTALADFSPDCRYGQILAGTKNTDQSLLAGLPDGKYLFLGGALGDPKVATELMSDLFDPMQPEIDKLGPDGKIVADYIQAIKDIAGAQTAAAFGMFAPEGELGTSPLMQFVTVRQGDAKTMASATDTLMQAQQASVKAMGANAGPIVATYTQAAKTVDGVQFDQYHTGFDPTVAGGPEMAKIGQILTMVYGQDGLNIYSGAINDTTFLQIAGTSDDVMSAAIEAAKSGADPMGKEASIQSTASHLPTQRVVAFYVPVDVLINTVFTYIGKFGIEMGITMPAADPIGTTLSTDGSALRADSYVSTQLISSVADIVQKLAFHRTRPGATTAPDAGAPAVPNPPAPPQPGGL